MTLRLTVNLRRAAPLHGLRYLVCGFTPFYGGQVVPDGKPQHNPAHVENENGMTENAIMPCDAVVKSATASTRRLPGRVGQGVVSAANTCAARFKGCKSNTLLDYNHSTLFVNHASFGPFLPPYPLSCPCSLKGLSDQSAKLRQTFAP